MTCLRADQARLRITARDGAHVRDAVVAYPAAWSVAKLLAYAEAVHAPYGHVVTLLDGGTSLDLWLANPADFTDYEAGVRA